MHYERWRKYNDPEYQWSYSPEGLKARQKSLTNVRQLSPSHQHIGKRVKLNCAHPECDKIIVLTPGSAKYRKYCSKSCLAKDQKGKRRPMSQQQREKIGASQRQRYLNDPTSNPFYGRTPTNFTGWGHGQFVPQLGYWVRSTWERDYLLALHNAGVLFEYEPKRFDLLNGRGTYMPDIRLDGRDIYVEITGWDKEVKKQKRALFTEVYGYPLYVIDKKPTAAHIAEFIEMCREVIRVDASATS